MFVVENRYHDVSLVTSERTVSKLFGQRRQRHASLVIQAAHECFFWFDVFKNNAGLSKVAHPSFDLFLSAIKQTSLKL